jgi:hypothetical protein
MIIFSQSHLHTQPEPTLDWKIAANSKTFSCFLVSIKLIYLQKVELDWKITENLLIITLDKFLFLKIS